MHVCARLSLTSGAVTATTSAGQVGGGMCCCSAHMGMCNSSCAAAFNLACQAESGIRCAVLYSSM
jgi:hypothetical protein